MCKVSMPKKEMFPTTTHVLHNARILQNDPATVPWMQGRRLCVVRYLQNTKDKSNEGFLCKHVSSFLAPF
jgi:hypothetical protein